MGIENKIHVALGGPFPVAGVMPGTFGRVLGNMLASPILSDNVRFTTYNKSQPPEGGKLKRAGLDAFRLAGTLAKRPNLFHLLVLYRGSTSRDYLALRAAKSMGMKTLCDIRAGALQYSMELTNSASQNAMLDWMFRECDALSVECASDADFIHWRCGRKPVYLPNCLRKAQFDAITPASLQLEDDTPISLTYSGRYVPNKGLFTMIDALEVLSRRGRNVELHLYGEGAEEYGAEAVRRLNRLIAEFPSRATANVRLVDHGPFEGDLFDMLAKHHIFTMLTTHSGEGHSNSLLEAMASGLALILSNWKHRTSVAPQTATRLVSADDPEVFADAVEYFIDNPQALVAAGKASRDFVERNFLDTITYPRLLSIYRRLAGR